MEFLYFQGARQRGPCTVAELRRLEREGAIHPDTLVWSSGLPEWVPYSVLLDEESSSPHRLCSYCGKLFSIGDLIEMNNVCVCGACKPEFLQTVKETGQIRTRQELWRDGRRLVATRNSRFPHRCIKCNGPAVGEELVFTLRGTHRLRSVSLNLSIPLCDQHRRLHSRLALSSGLLATASIVFFIPGLKFAGTSFGLTLLFLAGLSFSAAMVLAYIKTNFIQAVRIDRERVWIKGISPDFVDSQPPWNP